MINCGLGKLSSVDASNFLRPTPFQRVKDKESKVWEHEAGAGLPERGSQEGASTVKDVQNINRLGLDEAGPRAVGGAAVGAVDALHEQVQVEEAVVAALVAQRVQQVVVDVVVVEAELAQLLQRVEEIRVDAEHRPAPGRVLLQPKKRKSGRYRRAGR